MIFRINRPARLLRRALSGLALGVALAADPLATPVAPLSSLDIGFDIRVDRVQTQKGDAAAFALLAKEYARDPRPHVAARYAEFLIVGKDWGAPDGQLERGIGLAQTALAAGSQHALMVVGWNTLVGSGLPADPARGLAALRQTAEAGNNYAAGLLGDAYLRGLGTPVDAVAAEEWFMRRANGGQPYRLFLLGNAYEEGRVSGQPDLAKACALYYEGDIRGSGSCAKRLTELAAKG
ncbi:MAG: hypothetical protein RLZZ15_492, partial [Verrucomicrobiota bacterium]